MKKFLMVVMLLVMSATVSHAQSLKIMGRDYNPLDWNEHPLAIGAITWSDNDYDFEPGIYGQMCFVSWKDAVRLNSGVIIIWNSEKNRPSFRPNTSITFGIPVGDLMFEAGIYYAPFWGLYDKSDDPWGFMLGYAF